MNKLLNFFKDKNGRVVIVQTPNSPLIGFILFTVLGYFWNNNQPIFNKSISAINKSIPKVP